jgi:hypothetical protein
MKFASIIAALDAVLATPAAAQPLERQHTTWTASASSTCSSHRMSRAPTSRRPTR